MNRGIQYFIRHNNHPQINGLFKFGGLQRLTWVEGRGKDRGVSGSFQLDSWSYNTLNDLKYLDLRSTLVLLYTGEHGNSALMAIPDMEVQSSSQTIEDGTEAYFEPITVCYTAPRIINWWFMGDKYPLCITPEQWNDDYSDRYTDDQYSPFIGVSEALLEADPFTRGLKR